MTTTTTKTGNTIKFARTGIHADARISNVTESCGVVLVTARSAKAADELASEYAAWGAVVEVEGRNLKVA